MNWELLIRYIEDEVNDADRRAIENWLDEKDENRLLFQYLQRRRAEHSQPVKEEVINEEWLKLMERVYEQPRDVSNSRPFKYRWLAAAATVALVCTISMLLVKKQQPPVDKYSAIEVSMNRKKVSLPDGSLVYLAPGAQLQVNNAYGASKRELKLQGEAFFDVKHDKGHPFIVYTGNKGQVNVMGTSFSVYTKANAEEEVQVATGLVGFVSNGRTWYLKAGERLAYSPEKHAGILSKVNAAEASRLMDGVLYFNKNNIREIASILTRYYHLNIDVAQSAQGKYPLFSGTMKDNGITALLTGLNYATGIHHKRINSNTILLY